ncbi:hypothetical protein [Rhodococcus koreensis]
MTGGMHQWPRCEYQPCKGPIGGQVIHNKHGRFHPLCWEAYLAHLARKQLQPGPDPGTAAELDSSAIITAHLVFMDALEQRTEHTSLADCVKDAIYAYEWAKLNAKDMGGGYIAYPSLADARAAMDVYRTKTPEEV